jgi:hypothetical protein
MKTIIIIYVVIFLITIGTFAISHLLFSKFPNSKLTKFWRKHIVTDEDLEHPY